MYAVVNKFIVQKNHHKDFIKETKRVWIRNYKKSYVNRRSKNVKQSGFVRTLILQKGNVFLTIDFWKSKTHADRFFRKNLSAMEAASWVSKRYVEREGYDAC